jgi:hypothetical protein
VNPCSLTRPYSTRAIGSLLFVAIVASWPLLPRMASAQSVDQPVDTTIETPDPGDVRGAARAAQARYEIRRARHFPQTFGGSSGPCDETVGRFCTWYGEGDWVPEPEAPEIDAMRGRLIAELDSLQRAAPADGWIFGHRVWYRAERGDWEDALEVARSCGPPQETWWCAALEGLALHGLGRWVEAERAFDVALYEMDLERAWDWRVPVRAVDGDARDFLEELRTTSTDSVARTTDRLWRLADPLHLVEGNDRKTAHFARWTVATLRDGSRTPYGISWGSDLEELLVRHGWEIGWEREPSRRVTERDRIVGRKHPDGRDYLPPGRALVDPASAVPDDYLAGRTRPRSLYAPPYAPVVLPLEGQIAMFPRGRTFTVVATHFLPTDTTRRAREGIPRPWSDSGDQADLPDRAGLFLLDAASGEVTAGEAVDGAEGALRVEGAAGRHVLSVETWSPSRRLAGRLRMGVAHTPVPEDLPVLSDILLVDAEDPAPASLDDALPRALTRASVREGESVGIAWEVTGLGFRRETLAFDLSVERLDRNLLQRLGGLFGLSEPPRPLTLRWEETGPEEPGPVFRAVDLDLPGLEPGRYEVRLRLMTSGREPVTATRAFEVRATAPR